MKKVLILFGGNSGEHNISCKSCKNIIENIDKELFLYEVVGISHDNKWYIFNDDLFYLENGNWLDGNILEIENIINYIKTFDVVFPVIHGVNGEDGKLQGMLEMFGIKFVGCKTLSSAIGMDKEMSKIMFSSLDIPQVPYIIINEEINIEKIINNLNFPMIVKPSNGGSSIGITKVENKKELIEAIKEAKRYDNKVIIEKFIKCRELECAILETNDDLIVSNPGEIKSANCFYDYEAKYINENSFTIIPEDLPVNIVNSIKEYAVKIFKGLYCNGLARIDFFYDEETNFLYINEINTIPGFTTISMYPKLINDKNISYKQLITLLINNS